MNKQVYNMYKRVYNTPRVGAHVVARRSQLLRRNVKQFRGGLVLKAHRLVYYSTPDWRVIKKKKEGLTSSPAALVKLLHVADAACPTP